MIIILIVLMAGVVPAISWYMRRQAVQAVAAARQAAIEAQKQRPPGLVMITGGQFLRGSDDGKEIERPLNSATIGDFFIDVREVTNNQYLRFIKATNRSAPANWPGGKIPAGQETIPVTDVTWTDAMTYCQWRNQPDGFKFRLPTEAEWEYAARGRDGRRYPWGNDWVPGNANGKDSGRNQPVAAGTFSSGASPFGLQDMSGNVAEWTADNLNLYPQSKAKLDPRHASDKIIKGGSFADSAENLTTSYRSWMSPDSSSDKVGFRCVATK
jgi:serine/threonine-protein kinase